MRKKFKHAPNEQKSTVLNFFQPVLVLVCPKKIIECPRTSRRFFYTIYYIQKLRKTEDKKLFTELSTGSIQKHFSKSKNEKTKTDLKNRSSRHVRNCSRNKPERSLLFVEVRSCL